MPLRHYSSASGVPSSPAVPRPLLALRGASAEWRVGVTPHCAATVRLLDRVSFAVAAGECVVVQHRDPAGVRVLLAALAGELHQPTATVRGTRIVRAGVRVRRTSIRTDLVATLVAAWQAPATAHRSAAPAVHLLRASRRATGSEHDHAEWFAWAAAQRASGGALVIVADLDSDTGPPGRPVTVPRTPSGVHESSRAYAHPGYDEARTAGAVRACRWRFGRLADATDREPVLDYCWPSEAPVVLGP